MYGHSRTSGADGGPERTLNTMPDDLTELLRGAELVAEMEQVRRQLGTILDVIADGVIGIDLAGRVTFANPAACNMLSADETGLIGQHADRVLGRGATPPMESVLEVGGLREHELHLAPPSAEPFPAEMTVSVQTQAGVLIGGVLVFRDITDRVARRAALERLASTDALTGLPNRRALEAALEQAAVASDCSLLFCDLDGFKAINDVHGHDIGDVVLAVVARRLKEVTRGSDLVARLAGDEFCVLLESGDQLTAEAVAARAQRSVARPIDTDAGAVSVGVSVGVVSHRPGESAASMLRRADQGMYQQKRQRREQR
jgi:diguanylate cyclase (GGDEF)-like protein/PAS domain S-box-containing protein